MLFLSYNVDSTLRALIGQKPMLSEYKRRKKRVLLFVGTLSLIKQIKKPIKPCITL